MCWGVGWVVALCWHLLLKRSPPAGPHAAYAGAVLLSQLGSGCPLHRPVGTGSCCMDRTPNTYKNWITLMLPKNPNQKKPQQPNPTQKPPPATTTNWPSGREIYLHSPALPWPSMGWGSPCFLVLYRPVEDLIPVLAMAGVLPGTKFLQTICLPNAFQAKLVCEHAAVSWAAQLEEELLLNN